MVFLFELYWLFALPMPSSFRLKTERSYGGQFAEEALIQGSLEGSFHTMALMFLPLLLHIGSHHARLFSSANAICDLLLLFFVPLLFQLYASTKGALNWLYKDQHLLQQVRLMNGAIALLVVILCLEVRVVFYSFGQYIQIPSPWNYILVTIAALGGAAGLVAYLFGLIGDALTAPLLTSLMVAASFSASIAIGLPWMFLPAPVIAAYFIAQFFLNKSIVSYTISVVAAVVPLTWFVVHNFWYLNIWLGGAPLQTICKYIIGGAVVAMGVPALSLLPNKLRYAAEAGLVIHALIVCHLENRLYNFTSIYYFSMEDDVVYPSYMVVFTTVLGLVLVHRLVADKRISSVSCWLTTCFYLSKLSMLFLSSPHVVWAAALLLLAVTPPLLLYKTGNKGGGFKMKPWQGMGHAAIIGISVWLCRFTLFEALQWWTGLTPSDGLILGSLILSAGVACAPIVTQHFSHIQSAKRALVLVISVGLLLTLMQPPVPEAWTFWWDKAHMPERSADSLSIYGAAAETPTWPTWLLIVTITISLAALTSAIPIQDVVELRLVYAVGMGVSTGVYLCAQYFLQAAILHVLLVAAMVCASVFLVFTHLPSATSPRLLPWVFAILVGLCPVIYLAEGQLRFRTGDRAGSEDNYITLFALEGSRVSLLGLYAAIFMAIAFEIKLKLASIIADKLSDKVVGGPGPKYRLAQQRKPSSTSAFSVKKLAAEGAWMATIGNVATLLCFSICLILNLHLTGGSDRSIVVLAPILLLLNQDANLSTGFGDRQRYFPLTAAASGYLIVSAGYRLWIEVWHGYHSSDWGLQTGGPGLFYLVKNIILLMLTTPNHFLFNRFMWNYLKQSDITLLLTTPMNLPVAIITDIVSIRFLACIGMVYALVQYLISRNIRIADRKSVV